MPHARADCCPDGRADRIADDVSDGCSDGNADCGTDIRPHGFADGCADCLPDSCADRFPDARSDGCADGCTHFGTHKRTICIPNYGAIERAHGGPNLVPDCSPDFRA